MHSRGVLFTSLLSLASANPIFPVARPFIHSNVAREPKFPTMAMPKTFYDLPTGDPKPLVPTSSWRRMSNTKLYKDPLTVGPLWYSEHDPGLANDALDNSDQVITATQTTSVAPTSGSSRAVLVPKWSVEVPEATSTPSIVETKDIETVNPTSRGPPPPSQWEIQNCWALCSEYGSDACSRCDDMLKNGARLPATLPWKYDPWGNGLMKAEDAADKNQDMVTYVKLWKCAVECLRNDNSAPCTRCDGLWAESEKALMPTATPDNIEFWSCLKQCSRDKSIECTRCEELWDRQQKKVSIIDPANERMTAYVRIWQCLAHCQEDDTGEACARCDELWKKWDAGLPPFGAAQTDLIKARKVGPSEELVDWRSSCRPCYERNGVLPRKYPDDDPYWCSICMDKLHQIHPNSKRVYHGTCGNRPDSRWHNCVNSCTTDGVFDDCCWYRCMKESQPQSNTCGNLEIRSLMDYAPPLSALDAWELTPCRKKCNGGNSYNQECVEECFYCGADAVIAPRSNTAQENPQYLDSTIDKAIEVIKWCDNTCMKGGTVDQKCSLSCLDGDEKIELTPWNHFGNFARDSLSESTNLAPENIPIGVKVIENISRCQKKCHRGETTDKECYYSCLDAVSRNVLVMAKYPLEKWKVAKRNRDEEPFHHVDWNENIDDEKDKWYDDNWTVHSDIPHFDPSPICWHQCDPNSPYIDSCQVCDRLKDEGVWLVT
jgi:hypothetical protein